MSDSLSPAARSLLQRRLIRSKANDVAPPFPTIRANPTGRFEPFPLNDMQQAYWIGRQGDDQTGMHYFMERRTSQFDFKRLCQAWDRLLGRHDMLRVVLTEDGQQRVLPHAPGTGAPECIDLTLLGVEAQAERLSALRDELAHYKADLTQWPQHRVYWCDVGGGGGCLMISLDIWCIDGQSIQTLVSELGRFYADPVCALPEPGMTFRDYLLASQEFEGGPVYARALAYWRARLAQLPGAPNLPLETTAGISVPPRFERCEMRLTLEETRSIRRLVADGGLTLATLLAAAYAEVLARWSTSRHFLLNMPRFNRKPIHPDIQAVLGEFATFTLLEVRLDFNLSFGERIAAMQQQLWLDMENDSVSGVRVLRELNQMSGGRSHAPAPIVFTSLPETVSGADNLHEAEAALGELTYSLSQTPQVWLDCQYYQAAGSLRINWDYLAGRFPPGMVAAMFESFADLVRRLASADGAKVLEQVSVVSLPEAQLAQRQAGNATDRTWPKVSLAQRLLDAARQWPDKPALVVDESVWSFRALMTRASALAKLLQGSEGRVAIRLGKSVEQIVAVLACVLAGRSYVPIDVEQPQERQREIAQLAKVTHVLASDDQPNWSGVGEVLVCSRWPEPLAALPTEALDWSPTAEIYLLFTSGSTGEPKGVPILQLGLVNLLEHNAEWLQLTSADRVFGVSALHHDMSVAELLGSLPLGATLVMPSQAYRRDPEQWFTLMQKHGVSYWSSVPALAEMLLDHGEARQASLENLRQVTLGGDWLPVNIGQRFSRLAPGAAVHSIGGPTEITVWNVTHTLQSADASGLSIPYGKPISNSRFYILDEQGEDCPDWVCGELVSAGHGLSPGYLNGVVGGFGPLGNRESHGYRTGDLGRYLPDGRMEFVGRSDSQVKLNGLRIELGEIEGVVQRHPLVRRVVVELRRLPYPHLLAWVEGEAEEEALREHVARVLPAAMVPARWQRCETWPLNANGKIDRRALSERSLVDDSSTQVHSELEGALEQWLGECWAALLGRRPESRQANFFHLGGDSLLAVRMLGAIETRTGVRLSAQQIFATPTLHQLADKLGEELATAGRSFDDVVRATSRALPARSEAWAPLSWSQRGLWLIEQQEPGSTAYTLPLLFSLEGAVDAERLCKAIDTVLAGHEILRSRFGFDPQRLHPFLVPDSDSPRVAQVCLVDGQQPGEWIDGYLRQGFDLPGARSARAALVATAEGAWMLVFQFHHIVFDGWSSGVLMRQVAEVYEELATKGGAALKERRFGDYSTWEQAESEDAQAVQFWREQLRDLPVLNLTTDRPRPARMDRLGGSVSRSLSLERLGGLETLAQDHGTTLFMVLLSTYQLLLGRYSQQEDIVVGTYVAGREHPATHDMLGCFVNNVLMRTQWEPEQSFGDFLAHNRGRILAALEHQSYPFERLVALCSGARDDSRHPLYQAGFAMQPRHAWPQLDGGVSVRQLPPPLHTSHMDLDLYVVQDADGLWLELNYASSLFDEARMHRFLEHYVELLDSVVGLPNQPLIQLRYWAGQAEVPALRQESPRIDLPERLLAALVDGADRCALIDRGEPISFAQLLEHSQQIAAGLLARGVGRGDSVGVYLPRSAEQVAIMLGIFFAGAVYLPLDADYPVARISTILSLAKPALVLSDDSHRELLPARYAAQALPWRTLLGAVPLDPICTPAAPGEAMYMLFTSGSTGTPKGVVGTWLTAQNRTDWAARAYPLGADDCCAIRTPLNFVDSLWEILDPLLATSSCVIVPTATLVDSRRLVPMMVHHGVRRMVVVPSLIRSWLRDAADLLPSWRSLNLLLSSAEVPDPADVAALQKAMPGLCFVNCYGSSEVADVTAYLWPSPPSAGDEAVLGKPLPGNSIVLLDKWGRVVAPGNSGHIHVVGNQLPQGYLELPVSDSSAAAIFPMGDWGHWRADGELVFEGRMDDLVKIRGSRVELGEVNQHLRAALDEGVAIALAAPDPSGGQQLVAWLEYQGNSPGELSSRVRRELVQRLPGYMVPSRYEVVTELPRLPNGKIDRMRLLRELCVAAPPAMHVLDEGERELAKLVAPLLGCRPEGIDPLRGFYELGINSLTLAGLHARLQAAYPGARLSMTDLFQYSTLRQLAGHLSNPHAGRETSVPVPSMDNASAPQRRRAGSKMQGNA